MSICRTSWLRDAPKANRTAVCERLADPRDSSKLAMFAQAISRSNAESVTNKRSPIA